MFVIMLFSPKQMNAGYLRPIIGRSLNFSSYILIPISNWYFILLKTIEILSYMCTCLFWRSYNYFVEWDFSINVHLEMLLKIFISNCIKSISRIYFQNNYCLKDLLQYDINPLTFVQGGDLLFTSAAIHCIQ